MRSWIRTSSAQRSSADPPTACPDPDDEEEIVTRVIVSVVGGASIGGVFALVALGMVLTYRATRVFNFAQGQLMLLPAFLVGSWSASGTPIGVAIAAAVLGTGAIGAVIYRAVLQRTTGLPPFMAVIATFGVASILDGVMQLTFRKGAVSIGLPGLSQGVTKVLGTRVATGSLELMAVEFAIILSVVATLRLTSLGRKVRAAGQDPILASQGGINVRRLHMLSWALSGSLAAIAGVVYGATHLVDSTLVTLMFAAFPAVLIGGLDSIGGVLVGGLLVGMCQGFVATYFSPELIDVATYTLLLGVMLFLPNGFWGTRPAIRV
jgi:branched-chain amino acid transport system permease protein